MSEVVTIFEKSEYSYVFSMFSERGIAMKEFTRSFVLPYSEISEYSEIADLGREISWLLDRFLRSPPSTGLR